MDSIDIFPWDDNFNTGIAEIDAQHRKLVRLINLLASDVAFGAAQEKLDDVFNELTAYTVYHFQTEEAIWHRYLADDPAEVAHRRTHADFVDKVMHLRREQGIKTLAQVTEEALSFLVRWLVSHILQTDRYMAYQVQALQAGLTLQMAQARATEQMGGATRAMIDIILSIYSALSSNTLRLMRELTAQRHMETELREAKQRAEAANLAKSQFLATMSHEIRTPLNGVLGMAQLLLMPDLEATEREEYARTIINSGKTLLTLLNDVLDLSKVEAGKLELVEAAFSPAQLLEEVAALLVGNAVEKGLALSANWHGAPDCHFRGDPIRIRQMLGNLIGNAIKFTDCGQILVEAEVVARDTDSAVETLRFTVIDTGIGIPATMIERLFQPFSQVDASDTRRFGGTGLGLSIIRALARQMGGTVGVASEEGVGSRFWFELPLQPVAPADELRQAPRAHTLSAADVSGRPEGSILLVEDNAVNCLVIERMLDKFGFSHLSAHDGAAGVALYQREAASIGLILMDMQMPVMDGLEATRQIRRWQAAQALRTPIIALTANVFDTDREACLAAGMDDFLGKPVNADILQQMLLRWLPPGDCAHIKQRQGGPETG